MSNFIVGIKYIELVKLFFSFLITEYGFRISKEAQNGNAFFDVEYSNNVKVISISYENIEDYLSVIIFNLNNGKLPDFDDNKLTLHLNEINKRIFPKIEQYEIEKNIEEFNIFKANSDLEMKLLKSAKELRLALKYWDKL